jgi:hypothetical protein
LTAIVGIYIRLGMEELLRLRDHPDVLPKYDPRVALGDGRGLDIGRAWEELGAFYEGGVKVPESGPTVGEVPLHCDDQRAAWSYVEPERVAVFADKLRLLRRAQFRQRYESDGEDTLTMPGTMTGEFGDREKYMYKKLRLLARHYADAAASGEGMLVRIGARV